MQLWLKAIGLAHVGAVFKVYTAHARVLAHGLSSIVFVCTCFQSHGITGPELVRLGCDELARMGLDPDTPGSDGHVLWQVHCLAALANCQHEYEHDKSYLNNSA